MQTYKLRITFTEPLLGTVPKNPEVYSTYIASLAENTGDELETVPENVEEKGWTGFHEVEGEPVLYNYVLKGFFKDACGMLRRVKETETRSKKLSAYKKVIDGLVFVTPRRIPVAMSGPMSVLERSLRASTAQGDRVALVRSDSIPAGSSLECEITVLGEVSEELLREWLDYGAFRGLGQWRNGGYGSFEYELTPE